MPTFGEKLRELREKAMLTQQQLADASGLPLGSLRNYEQGQREPYWAAVFKLAEALSVPVDTFAECVATSPLLPGRKGTATRKPAPAKRRGR